MKKKITWLLAAALLADTALLFVWVREPRFLPRSIRVIPALSACLGLGVAAYTGLLLQSLAAVPLWDTVALPLLFVASSLSCGVSLMLAIVRLSGVGWRFEAVAAQWERVDIAVLLVEAVAGIGFVAVQVLRAQSGSTGTLQALALSLQTLLAGPDAWVFWGVFGGLGIAAPLALAGISLLAKPSPMMPFAQASATLIGAFAMRWSIVQAGFAIRGIVIEGEVMRSKQQASFPFEVDESTDVPLWVQLRQRIMHLISTGYFKPGDKLPTVRGLAQDISINYNTVNKAYLSLVSDGILESTRGRGVFVRDVATEDGAEHAQEVEGILDDCISACRDLGLSLEDIQQHMARRILQMQKAESGADGAAPGEPRIVRVDVRADSPCASRGTGA